LFLLLYDMCNMNVYVVSIILLGVFFQPGEKILLRNNLVVGKTQGVKPNDTRTSQRNHTLS